MTRLPKARKDAILSKMLILGWVDEVHALILTHKQVIVGAFIYVSFITK